MRETRKERGENKVAPSGNKIVPNIHDSDPDKEMAEGKKSARAMWAKDKIDMPPEMQTVMEFWEWQQARGLPRKGEVRRIYTHEEIVRGEWKGERDGILGDSRKQEVSKS